MEMIEVKKMFTNGYLEELKAKGEHFYGQDRCVNVNGKLYMPFVVAEKLGYKIIYSWIEDIKL